MTTRRSNFLLPSFLILAKKKRKRKRGDWCSIPCLQQKQQWQRGEHYVPPCLWGLQRRWQHGNIMLPPIFDSYNKDIDGEGLVPTPPLCFQFIQWRWQWGGGQMLCFPLIFGCCNKDEKEEEGGEHCHPSFFGFYKTKKRRGYEA